jgi:hypothetical protein
MSLSKKTCRVKKLARKICELTLTLVGLSSPDGGCQPLNIVIDIM